MPSINDIREAAEPVIREQVANAYLQGQLHALAQVKRQAFRAKSVAAVVAWCELNEEIIHALEQDTGDAT